MKLATGSFFFTPRRFQIDMSYEDPIIEHVIYESIDWLRDEGLIDSAGNLTALGCAYYAVPSGQVTHIKREPILKEMKMKCSSRRILKKMIIALAVIPLAGCLGLSSAGNEAVGQVKRIQHKTPIFCPDYNHVDVSLGVMRNGVGSVSTQDIWLYVPNAGDAVILNEAAQSGALVKINYDVARSRWFWCVETETLTHVELVK